MCLCVCQSFQNSLCIICYSEQYNKALVRCASMYSMYVCCCPRGAQASVSLDRSQARKNAQGCGRKGIQYKTIIEKYAHHFCDSHSGSVEARVNNNRLQ